MKKILNLIIILMLCVGFAGASTVVEQKKPTPTSKNDKKKNKEVTLTYSVNIHCESCEKKVLNTIPFQRGIKNVVVDMENHKVEVSFDSSKTDNEKIIESFKKLKMDATLIQG